MSNLILARAAADPLNANALIVLIGSAAAAAAALLAAVPAMVAHRRRHAHRESLTALAVVWALVLAAAVVWSVNRDWAASDRWNRQVAAGDVDPRELPAAPPSLWPLWLGLASAYAGLITWAAAPLRAARPPD